MKVWITEGGYQSTLHGRLLHTSCTLELKDYCMSVCKDYCMSVCTELKDYCILDSVCTCSGAVYCW